MLGHKKLNKEKEKSISEMRGLTEHVGKAYAKYARGDYGKDMVMPKTVIKLLLFTNRVGI